MSIDSATERSDPIRYLQATVEGEIADTKKDSEQFRQERDKWRALFRQTIESLPEPVVISEVGGKIQGQNHAATEMYEDEDTKLLDNTLENVFVNTIDGESTDTGAVDSWV